MTTAIDHASQLGRLPPPRLTFGYYRQPNGWITVSPMTELEELRYRREGWEPLPQYGRVEMATQYAADHPFEGLFIHGGGYELATDQVIAMGLHLNPPLVPTCGQSINQYHKRHTTSCWAGAQPVQFPQVSDAPPAVACRFCSRAFPGEDARDQHETVIHKEERGDIRQGESLGESLARALQGTGQVATKQVAPEQRNPYACGLCSESFTSPKKLMIHIRDDHKVAEEAEQEGAIDGQED